MKIKRMAFNLIVCMFLIILLAPYVYGAEQTIVEGLIEKVAGDFIKIKGKEYNIYNVPVKDFGGRDASKRQIKRGVFARVVFEGGKITALLIDVSE